MLVYSVFIILLIIVIVNFNFNFNNIIEYFNIEFNLDKNNKILIDKKCKHSGSGFNDKHELGECSVAYQIIPYVNNVLEIGGGTGKVSHNINIILQKKGIGNKHIVIEPGLRGNGNHGDKHIYINKKKFNDKYTIIPKLANELTKEDLKILDFKPDCLYADCEGCLLDFCKSEIGKYILNSVRYIINEMDGFAIHKDLDNELRKI